MKGMRMRTIHSFALITALLLSLASGVAASESGPWLGIAYKAVGEDAKDYNLDRFDYPLVTLAATDSVARASGIQQGDVITAVNGERVRPETLRDRLIAVSPGETVTLTLNREGFKGEVDVTRPQATKTATRRTQSEEASSQQTDTQEIARPSGFAAAGVRFEENLEGDNEAENFVGLISSRFVQREDATFGASVHGRMDMGDLNDDTPSRIEFQGGLGPVLVLSDTLDLYANLGITYIDVTPPGASSNDSESDFDLGFQAGIANAFGDHVAVELAYRNDRNKFIDEASWQANIRIGYLVGGVRRFMDSEREDFFVGVGIPM